MKRPLHVFRLLVIVLCVAFVTSGAGYTQDDAPDQQPTDIGTPGLVEAMDNLNLPPVPVSPNATPSDTAPAQGTPPILPDTATTPPTNPWAELQAEEAARTAGVIFAKNVISERNRPVRKPVHQQPREPVFSETDPKTGDTLMVYSDYTFVLEDSQGTTGLTGYFGIVGDDKLIAIGEDRDGVRYAFGDRYFSAYTPDGDVLIGNAYTVYTYDFDESGKLLGLTDNNGGTYQVDVGDSGSVSIDGSDGYKIQADETSSAVELYNPGGDLVASGELNDASVDEFAQFEASATENTPNDTVATDTSSDESIATESSPQDNSSDNTVATESSGTSDSTGGG